ncbi:MAG: hypothetical protein R3349_01465 [Geminicoccaceae bacterium]|nr:hypothetical protein [Geminicoccaceae bacterium]
MSKGAGWLVAGMLAVFAMPASAGEGTLDLMPRGAWAEELADGDMAELRGGFGGLAFSVFFSGGFDKLGNAQGQLDVGSNGAAIPSPEFDLAGDQVNIRTEIGNFQGASGIFQIAQVPGDYNIVNNNLFVQIAVFNSGSFSDVFGARLVP